MDTDQTSTEQTFGRTYQNGKKYAQHHIYKDENTNNYDKRHRYNLHCEKNEMILGRTYQPPQRRPMHGPRVSPLGDHMTRKDDKGDRPSEGETTWTNTGATRYGREHV